MDVRGHLHTLASLPLQMRPRHPLNMWLGGILGRSDSFWEEKSLAVVETRNTDSAVPRVVSVPTGVLKHAIYTATINFLKPRGYCMYHQY